MDLVDEPPGTVDATRIARHLSFLADLAIAQMRAMDFRTLEERMRDHAFAEARREVDSWWSGDTYIWRPFREF